VGGDLDQDSPMRPYAPRSVRAAGNVDRVAEAPARVDHKTRRIGDPPWRRDNVVYTADPPDSTRRRVEIAEEEFGRPASLNPTNMPAPPALRRRQPLGITTLLLSAATIAAVVTLVLGGRFTPLSSGAGTGESDHTAAPGIDSAAPRPTQGVAMAPVPRRRTPLLAISSPARAGSNRSVPLGASVQGAGKGAVVVIGGLPAGTALSAGHRLTPDGWWIDVAELADVTVRPPAGFAGAMDLVVELRFADDEVADRGVLRLEWATPDTGASGLGVISSDLAPVNTSTPAETAASHLDPEELANLLARGQQFMSSGDVWSARLAFQPAADAHDPRAALAIGASYDPVILDELGIRGRVADISLARLWYERAKAWGSAEATGRLELLARRER